LKLYVLPTQCISILNMSLSHRQFMVGKLQSLWFNTHEQSWILPNKVVKIVSQDWLGFGTFPRMTISPWTISSSHISPRHIILKCDSGNVIRANRPRGNVFSGKCLFGKMVFGEMVCGEKEYGKMFRGEMVPGEMGRGEMVRGEMKIRGIVQFPK
jgi:hypothetical protein